MLTKKKAAIVIAAAAVVIIILAAAVMFAAAKPLMLPAYTKVKPNLYIHWYSFNGMTFSPCNSFIARNYSDADGSRISNMCNIVDQEIQQHIIDCVDEAYSSYHINADITRNSRDETVIAFSGEGAADDGETESIRIWLTIDWTKAIESSGDFVKISD